MEVEFSKGRRIASPSDMVTGYKTKQYLIHASCLFKMAALPSLSMVGARYSQAYQISEQGAHQDS
jgi:hypothetical protein